MTEKELEEIDARAKAATEGPWRWRLGICFNSREARRIDVLDWFFCRNGFRNRSGSCSFETVARARRI